MLEPKQVKLELPLERKGENILWIAPSAVDAAKADFEYCIPSHHTTRKENE